MKLTTKAALYLVYLMVITCCSQVVFAQNNDHTEHEDDSLKYAVPTRKDADIRILTPPSCFEVSTAFNGYICLSNGAAIMMHVIDNVSYPQAAKGMTDDFYRANGFTFISSFDLKSDQGVKGKVYKLGFKLQNNDYIRYIVLAGGLEETIWLNITYPKVVEEIMEIEILKSLQTLTLNPATDEKR